MNPSIALAFEILRSPRNSAVAAIAGLGFVLAARSLPELGELDRWVVPSVLAVALIATANLVLHTIGLAAKHVERKKASVRRRQRIRETLATRNESERGIIAAALVGPVHGMSVHIGNASVARLDLAHVVETSRISNNRIHVSMTTDAREIAASMTEWVPEAREGERQWQEYQRDMETRARGPHRST